jgi:hypothetical protein
VISTSLGRNSLGAIIRRAIISQKNDWIERQVMENSVTYFPIFKLRLWPLDDLIMCLYSCHFLLGEHRYGTRNIFLDMKLVGRKRRISEKLSNRFRRSKVGGMMSRV